MNASLAFAIDTFLVHFDLEFDISYKDLGADTFVQFYHFPI
jgi:hypothetical protein